MNVRLVEPCMLNRWFGIAVTALMLGANSALFLRDVAPRLMVGAPPKPGPLQLNFGERMFSHSVIYNGAGARIGRSWTETSRTAELTTVRTETFLSAQSFGTSVSLPEILIQTDLKWVDEDHLDEFEVKVRGLGMPVEIKGAFVPPADFPCKWQFGDQRGSFVLPIEATRAVGDVLRPVGDLPDLEVGQSWRHEIVNPLAKLMPEWSAANPFGEDVIIHVVGQEALELADRSVKAFVIEADRLKAWVGPDGSVLRQQIDLPLFGRLTVVDEPYDRRAHRIARQGFSGKP